MTKKICFVLILAMMGMANVNAQMRIGGSETPNKSAVLDLNPDDNVSAGNATLGLALPRVNLRNTNDFFPLLSHVKGMTVYNMATASDVKPGVYINNGAKWLRQLDSNTPVAVVERDSIVGNEVVDATPGGGLIRSGEGTEVSPYTLGIAIDGVTTDKIADQSVTLEKLAENVISELKEIITDIHNPELREWIINLILEHDQDGIVGNEVVDATIGGGLIRSGEGTEASPYTLGIATGGVTTDKIANRSITLEKLAESAISELKEIIMDIQNPMLQEWIINLILEHSQDNIVGNEVVGATDGSLTRSGSGTAASPYTLAVSTNGISTRHIGNQSVTMEKLSNEVLSEIMREKFVFDYHDPMLEERIINLIHEHEQDGVIGNEVVGATDSSLKRSGNGTTDSPYTLAVSEGGIEAKHLSNDAVTTEKIAENAITTRHIENNSVTVEKLSDDILEKLHAPVKPEDLIPADKPNSILISDAFGQWKAQQIAGNEYICHYGWTEQSSGWINLDYSDQSVPAGLYAVQIHINHEDSATPIDYVVLDAGAPSTYSLTRRTTEAHGRTVFVESCVIYKAEHTSLIRLFLHTTGTTRNGLAAVVLEPIIQLHR